MKRPGATWWVLLLACLAPGCAAHAPVEAAGARDEAPPAPGPTPTLAPATCGTLARLHALGDVFLAGQPSSEDFEALAAAGIRTVVNLRTEKEMAGFDEGARAAELGLAYVSVPWNGAEQLTDEVFARSRELLSSADRPLLVHCASANRVGAVWIPWRVLDGGIGLEDAVAEARTIGLKTGEYEAKARDYVARQIRH